MGTFKKLLDSLTEDGVIAGAATVMAGDVAQFTPVMSAGKKNKRKTLKKAKEIVDETSDNKMGVATSEDEDHAHYLANLKPEMVSVDGSANITSTSVNNHTHTVTLTPDQVKKILDQRQVRTHTSSDDGHTHEVVFISSKKLEELTESIQGEKVETQNIEEREDLVVVADRARKALSDEAERKRKESEKKRASMKESYILEDAGAYVYFREGEKNVFEMFEENDFNVFIQGLKRNNPRFWRTTPINEKMMEKMNENRGLWFEVRFGDRSYKPFDKR